MPKGFVYILECSDGTYYTGSTIDLEKRITEHKNGLGANHTKKRLPIRLVYFEEFSRIDEAFQREKQIQGWSRKKKKALIEKNYDRLPDLSKCKNNSHHSNVVSTPLNHHETALVAERSRSYTSNGKLLLTGEYVVLDGALALAVPTTYGQSLKVIPIQEPKLLWKSIDDKGNVWFETEFELQPDGSLKHVKGDETTQRLLQIFNAVKQLNSNFLFNNKGFKVTTSLDFPKNWGLGTSSTLINNMAQWAKVDPFELLALTFGGSGYDIACAQHNTPITYQINYDETPKRVQGNEKRTITPVEFNPSFKAHLYFVYLNKKQNSREGIAYYKSLAEDKKPVILEINEITKQLLSCEEFKTFQNLIDTHEALISKVTQQKTVKTLFFNDFKGSMKSLGAWGGDFVLVCSENDPTEYFNRKGFTTVMTYKDMVL